MIPQHKDFFPLHSNILSYGLTYLQWTSENGLQTPKTKKPKNWKYRLITAEYMKKRETHGRESLSKQEKVNALLNKLPLQ